MPTRQFALPVTITEKDTSGHKTDAYNKASEHDRSSYNIEQPAHEAFFTRTYSILVSSQLIVKAVKHYGIRVRYNKRFCPNFSTSAII